MDPNTEAGDDDDNQTTPLPSVDFDAGPREGREEESGMSEGEVGNTKSRVIRISDSARPPGEPGEFLTSEPTTTGASLN
ncbi:hypothetical protein PR003_g3596 [Phytophthora rubi]|uniref:Uncharacterized protein n=1 Tax=Phytophthora rubi TaxID=129364 RepID=A0A6A3NHP3_9STRA|nr:hypothetical protein PR002_g3578 [Phytophthora rubi]KAE9354003.1 hypothetical protein PR003_g3596 [Phytophthora rubi]